MDALEELRRQKTALADRLKLCREQLAQAGASAERAALQSKVSAYRAALKDIQVQLDHLDPPEARKARKEQRRRLDIGGLPFDFFEYSGTVWSDLEGYSWQQAEAGDFMELNAPSGLEHFRGDGGIVPDTVRAWLAEGARRLTDRQREYLDAYYNQGLSMEYIAQEHSVKKGTVSRVIRCGLDRLQEWVDAKRLISSCTDGRGGFDWARYLRQIAVLTDRQRELALLILSGLPKTQLELAGKLELADSTVCRTLRRAGETLRRLDAPRARPVIRPVITDWNRAGPVELALQTGMGLGFVYRFCARGRGADGLTRYQRELLLRKAAGRSAAETAQELGIPLKTVRSAWSRLRKVSASAGP